MNFELYLKSQIDSGIEPLKGLVNLIITYDPEFAQQWIAVKSKYYSNPLAFSNLIAQNKISIVTPNEPI